MFLLPYQGDKSIDLSKSLKRNLNKHLPNYVKTQTTFTCQKLSTQFNIKGKTKFEHKHDVILVSVQNGIVLIIILVNLLGESLSKL